MRDKTSRNAIRSACILIALICAAAPASAQTCQISYGARLGSGPITGRIILALARKREPEPRLLISLDGPAIFGVDVEALRPGQSVIIDTRSIGYPVHSMADLPAGEYFAQAIVNVYTEVHRADGHTIWVHLNDGRREFVGTSPGNLYSDVQRIDIGSARQCRIDLTHLIPSVPQPKDDQWVKHIRVQSKLLTQFWGHPIFINATVLLPKGYEDHPNVYYPAIFPLIHPVPFLFNTDPGSQAAWDQAAREETGLESGYEFYQSWISDHFPRVIAITFQQQTPFFPDSYAMNSPNNGPYGDALIEEVIPYLEKHFRMIPMPYARILEGASTGGWEALALQLHYPDFFGGAWVLQTDPIDFHRYQLVNIYQDENAFSSATGQFTSADRPFQRSTEGQVIHTVREESLFEAVLGSHGRSEHQFEGWEAAYGPVGPDGYPVPLWDKVSGPINHDVANYMREHGYDLREYAQRNWSTLGPRIIGKLYFFCADMDEYYLNLSVYRFQAFLNRATNPHCEGNFTYGRPLKGHSWHSQTWAQMVQDMAEHVKKNAPAGQDSSLWNY
jgi:hypothetical protein